MITNNKHSWSLGSTPNKSLAFGPSIPVRLQWPFLARESTHSLLHHFLCASVPRREEFMIFCEGFSETRAQSFLIEFEKQSSLGPGLIFSGIGAWDIVWSLVPNREAVRPTCSSGFGHWSFGRTIWQLRRAVPPWFNNFPAPAPQTCFWTHYFRVLFRVPQTQTHKKRVHHRLNSL